MPDSSDNSGDTSDTSEEIETAPPRYSTKAFDRYLTLADDEILIASGLRLFGFTGGLGLAFGDVEQGIIPIYPVVYLPAGSAEDAFDTDPSNQSLFEALIREGTHVQQLSEEPVVSTSLSTALGLDLSGGSEAASRLALRLTKLLLKKHEFTQQAVIGTISDHTESVSDLSPDAGASAMRNALAMLFKKTLIEFPSYTKHNGQLYLRPKDVASKAAWVESILALRERSTAALAEMKRSPTAANRALNQRWMSEYDTSLNIEFGVIETPRTIWESLAGQSIVMMVEDLDTARHGRDAGWTSSTSN